MPASTTWPVWSTPESGTDCCDHRGIAWRYGEVGVDRLSALDEQLYRRKLWDLVRKEHRTRLGNAQRRDTPDTFAWDAQRLAARRQQTMRATMDWSYGLLAEAERIVFQRLAVFVGGWSIEAAEDVCSGATVGRHDVLALITRLVDASLVQVEERDERARYRLLKPVRQYAHMCFSASGELDAVRRQHAAFFLSFAERWETDANFGGPGR